MPAKTNDKVLQEVFTESSRQKSLQPKDERLPKLMKLCNEAASMSVEECEQIVEELSEAPHVQVLSYDMTLVTHEIEKLADEQSQLADEIEALEQLKQKEETQAPVKDEFECLAQEVLKLQPVDEVEAEILNLQ